MSETAATIRTRLTSTRGLLAVGVVVLVLVPGAAHLLNRSTVQGTVTSKETRNPACSTERLYGPIGSSERVVCQDTAYTLHVRDAQGHDHLVHVAEGTYRATSVGSAYSG